MSRKELVIGLAPVAPPCFSDRLSWLEYLRAAAIDQRLDHAPGPLLFAKGEPVRFDPNFSYCGDCDMSYRSLMLKRDRCDPDFLRRPAVATELTMFLLDKK